MPSAMGLRSRVGMVSQRRVPPVTIVLFANSVAVRSGSTAAFTVGRLFVAMFVKLPFKSGDEGI
jgi:hypothetical protein